MIKEGVSLYLPVNVEGGLLAMGDLHAAMGDSMLFFPLKNCYYIPAIALTSI